MTESVQKLNCYQNKRIRFNKSLKLNLDPGIFLSFLDLDIFGGSADIFVPF